MSPDFQGERGQAPDQHEVGDKREEVVLGAISGVQRDVAHRGGRPPEHLAGHLEGEEGPGQEPQHHCPGEHSPGVEEGGQGECLARVPRRHQPLSDESEEQEEDRGHDAVPDLVVVHAVHLCSVTLTLSQECQH